MEEGYAGAGSAFYGSAGAGVRCPWRFANLNNGGIAGLACENGNNAPSNANWNGRPRNDIYEGGRKPAEMRLHIRAQAKISKTGSRESDTRRRGRRCAASSNKLDPAERFKDLA